MKELAFFQAVTSRDLVICDNEFLKLIEVYFNETNQGLIPFKVMDYGKFLNAFLGTIDDECLIDLEKAGYNPYYSAVLIKNYYLYHFLKIDDERYLGVNKIIDKYYQQDQIVINYYSQNIYFINPDLSNNLINIVLKIYPKTIVKEIYPINLTETELTKCDSVSTEVESLTNNLIKQYKKSPSQVFNIFVPSEDYLPYIYRNFDLYKLNYITDQQESLFDLDYVKDLVELLEKSNTYDLKLMEDFLMNIEPSEEKIKLVAVINHFVRFASVDYPYFKDAFISKLCQTKIVKKADTNIRIFTKLPEVIEKQQYFIVGFNQNVIIKTLTDSDFYSDELKLKNGLPISKDKNQFLQRRLIKKLLTLDKLYISYTTENHQIPSLLLDDLEKRVKVNLENPSITNDSAADYARYQIGKYLDEYEIYQKVNPEFASIYEEDFIDDYQKYNNQFNGKFKVDDKIKLSYTALNAYNTCSYQYYLKYILRIKEKDDKTNALVGNYFHDFLRDFSVKEKDIKDIDLLTQKYMIENDIALTGQNNYYYQKYQIYLIKVYDYIMDFDKRSDFDEIYYEKEIKKTVGSDSIVGRIDKMFIKDEGQCSKIVVIDYKTGSTIIDLPLIEYGLSLQVPFYFYLLASDEKTEIIGGYIQRIFPSKIYEYDENKEYEENFFDEYQYNGLSLNDEGSLKLIDANYESGKSIISGLKVKSDGSFYKTFQDKCLTKEEVRIIEEIVKKNIELALEKIHSGDFSINPKLIDGKPNCSYCKYLSICNRRYQNFIHLKKDKSLKFLRGDKDDTK